jgi:hypothetical protein
MLLVRWVMLVVLGAGVLICQSAGTQAPSGGGTLPESLEEVNKLKQNPVSGLKTVFFQNVNLPVGTGIANSFSVQPVWPFRIASGWKMITYTIVPLQRIPPRISGGPSASGLGNVFFNAFFCPEKAAGKFL